MFSEKTILGARKANLPEYLRAKGHELKREGCQFRVAGTTGLIVAENYWYNHVQQRGGNTLDYVIQIEGLGFVNAVNALKAYSNRVGEADVASRHREFQPPPKNPDNRRVISYLVKTRGIPYDVLELYLESEWVYQALGTNNCVFIGLDYDSGEVRYAFQRSSIPQSHIMFESPGSDKRHSFCIPGLSDTVFAFESIIDLFSYMSMEIGASRREDFYLSLGGLSSIALDHFTGKWDKVKKIIFCLDSDAAANEAYARLGKKYAFKGYSVSRHIPAQKDWNMQLLHNRYSFPAPPIPWRATS
jgi:hypothetical protein